jgi:hypothetical protein
MVSQEPRERPGILRVQLLARLEVPHVAPNGT